MTYTEPDEMPNRVVVAPRSHRALERIVTAAALWAALVAAAAAQTGPTASAGCRAKADVCEGNCAVRLRHSPELTSCRQGCGRRKLECLRTGTWRPVQLGQGQR